MSNPTPQPTTDAAEHAVDLIVGAGPEATTFVMECFATNRPDQALRYLAEWFEQQQ